LIEVREQVPQVVRLVTERPRRCDRQCEVRNVAACGRDGTLFNRGCLRWRLGTDGAVFAACSLVALFIEGGPYGHGARQAARRRDSATPAWGSAPLLNVAEARVRNFTAAGRPSKWYMRWRESVAAHHRQRRGRW
jgi:hypothetical protein